MTHRARKAAGIVILAAVLGIGSALIDRHNAVHAAGVMAPRFEVDPFWPKPLPNHWVIGQTIGLSVDAQDHIWMVHRPGTLEPKESYLATNSAECCIAAPDVLEFDEDGNLLRHWGKAEGHDWPASNHGILVDGKGNVWLGGNGRGGNPGGSAPLPATPGAARGAGRGPAAEGSGPVTTPTYHDSFILKFTADGKFLGEIGIADGSKGSNDINNVRGVAQMLINPKTNELFAADGYGNKRVSVWDADTLKYKRHWGAYGKTPDDTVMPAYDPAAPVAQQFRNPVHCVALSADDLLYVCDRVNDRIQIFHPDGTFIKEVFVLKQTRGDGSAWEIAFSRDPQQKFLYLSDGANEKIHIFDRATMTELTSFGDGGRQPGQFYAVHSIATDSKGNIFTTETYRGQRIQKFVYKGLAAVPGPNSGVPWPAAAKK
jgi:hypothetical protein